MKQDATVSSDSLEIRDLRHYTSAQLRPLLNEESQKWAEFLRWDYQASATMILRYTDNKILPGYAIAEGGEVVGYCFFIYEGGKGVVGDVFVSERTGNSRQSIALKLLDHVLETLQNSPGTTRIESQLLLPPAGWASAPFLKVGCVCHPRLFMKLPVGGLIGGTCALPVGFEIRLWQEKDYEPAAAVITAAYSGHVDSIVNDQYRTHSGALRFLNNIVRFPGCGYFDEDASFVVVHKSSGVRVGILLCSRVSEHVGHITQICLLPQFRKKGLGEKLIEACHSALLRRGHEAITLTVTEKNEGAIRLYTRLGFETVHRFDAFVWER